MAKGGFDPTVEKVRDGTDIVELIGAQVALKKAGSRFSGLCPFHQEKTPSFYVNPEMQAYHCFGCGEGGDAFSFVMKQENMSFPEALRFLAERAGIELPRFRPETTDRLERIREALKLARAWFQEQLAGPAGAVGREYLDRRGIGREMRRLYGLGLCPDAWDGLTRHARPLTSERTLIEAGLAVEAESGRVYDRFRNRLIIPIETPAGAPLGFGGRALGEQEPKYLNSPETPVYRKGAVLFGAGQAREGVRRTGRVVVVEGYFDVIALAQAGIGGVVGTCGTAMTPDQARLLRRLSDRVVLLFDGDSAGIRACQKALGVLVGEAREVCVCTPPAGKDPDLWVREEGREAVEAALERPRGALAYLQGLGESGVIRPREALGQAVTLAAQVQDPLDRDLWIQETASRFRVRVESIQEALRRGGRKAASAAGGEGRTRRKGVWSSLVRESLRSALAFPGRAEEIARALREAGLADEELTELIGWLGRSHTGEAGPSPASILSQAVREHPLAQDLIALAVQTETAPEAPETMLLLIRKQELIREMERLTQRIRQVEDSGEDAELPALLRERQRLARERARLENGGGSA